MQIKALYSIRPDMKMSEIVSNNTYFMLLLENFDITLPVADKTILEICKENNINPTLFLILANLYNGQEYKRKEELTFSDAESIVHFLKRSHNYYSDEIYPGILEAINQLAELNNSHEMALVPKFFAEYYKDVTEHLNYENDVVFPYVLELTHNIKRGTQLQSDLAFSSKKYIGHHDEIGEKLDDLKSLLIKYLPQKDDSKERRKILFLLSHLEFDLNIHSQIEELILEPLIKKMEKQLKGKQID